MARPGASKLTALVTISGMVSFLGALSIAPRVSIHRQGDSTIIRYEHLKKEPYTAAPADQGIILTPRPEPASPRASTRKPFNEQDWIFDTGATTHVCSNRSLLHGFNRLNPFNGRSGPRVMGYFGPNPIDIVGAGDVTFTLPAPSTSIENTASRTWPFGSAPEQDLRMVHRLTIKNVSFIPEAGVNLISWSQLKRAKGVDLHLVENPDGSLVVQDRGKTLMRFQLRQGLYYLDQIQDITKQASDGSE